MKKNLMIVFEALVVGIITVVVGHISSYLLSFVVKTSLPDVCKNWNENYIMEKSLFLTGFLVHIIAQILGINHWYCLHGVACMSK